MLCCVHAAARTQTKSPRKREHKCRYIQGRDQATMVQMIPCVTNPWPCHIWHQSNFTRLHEKHPCAGHILLSRPLNSQPVRAAPLCGFSARPRPFSLFMHMRGAKATWVLMLAAEPDDATPFWGPVMMSPAMYIAYGNGCVCVCLGGGKHGSSHTQIGIRLPTLRCLIYYGT